MRRKLILYRGIVPTLDDFTEQICHAAKELQIPYLLDVHEKGEERGLNAERGQMREPM